MPKNNRFNPSALQRVQQSYGAWTPAPPKREPGYDDPARPDESIARILGVCALLDIEVHS